MKNYKNFRAVSSLLTETLQQLAELRNLRDQTRFIKNLSAERKKNTNRRIQKIRK